jgi:hypothetical protein
MCAPVDRGNIDFIALASLVISLVALVISAIALRRSDKNSSASLLLTLSSTISSAWQAVFAADSQSKPYAVGELMNVFEMGCAIDLQGSLTGPSGDLVTQFLKENLTLLLENEEMSALARSLLKNKGTFSNIDRFLAKVGYE